MLLGRVTLFQLMVLTFNIYYYGIIDTGLNPNVNNPNLSSYPQFTPIQYFYKYYKLYKNIRGFIIVFKRNRRNKQNGKLKELLIKKKSENPILKGEHNFLTLHRKGMVTERGVSCTVQCRGLSKANVNQTISKVIRRKFR